jgi:hypothetical protein
VLKAIQNNSFTPSAKETLQQRTVKSYKNFSLPIIINEKIGYNFSTKISYNFFLTIIGSLKMFV